VKKTLLTLIISIIILGLTSVLFSLEKESTNNQISPEIRANTSLQPNTLPSSKNAFLTASLEDQISLDPNFIPLRNWSIQEPDIQAKAAGVFDPNGEKFLYRINVKEKLPIASLTKIMTAIVVLENLGLDEIITISKKAVMTEGENGSLIIGEKLTVRDLLYIMLIESSNDAAVALANEIDNFINLMNEKAKKLELEKTHFVDATGISKFNYSTISDLVQLAKYSLDKSLIWQILSVQEIDIQSQDKNFSHHLINTNKLLGKAHEIIGGKTGFTDEAGGCMLTIIKKPDKPGEYLIIIVLGADNRELETKKLINWVQKAYLW